MIVYASFAPIANVLYAGPVTNHFDFDGICEDCGQLVRHDTEDSIPYFEDCRCKGCQAAMYRYMEEASADDRHEDCKGCGAAWQEIESGETVHGCECGWELSQKECVEQSGLCKTCCWLNS